MKALLYKDLVQAKATYLLLLLVAGAVGIYAVSQGHPLLIPALFVYLPVLANGISFGGEAQAGTGKFIFTTPISRSTYVWSKYMLTLVLALLAAIATVIILRGDGKPRSFIILLASLAFFVPVFFSAIQIPFILKFGAEKGRILMVITYFLLFLASSFFSSHRQVLVQQLNDWTTHQPYLLSGGLLLLAVVLLFLSVGIGQQLMKQHEY